VEIGDVYLDPSDAGVVKALGELLGSMDKTAFTFEWQGEQPPVSDLPVAKLQRVLKMFGVMK
jgi:hypothetical protein